MRKPGTVPCETCGMVKRPDQFPKVHGYPGRWCRVCTARYHRGIEAYLRSALALLEKAMDVLHDNNAHQSGGLDGALLDDICAFTVATRDWFDAHPDPATREGGGLAVVR